MSAQILHMSLLASIMIAIVALARKAFAKRLPAQVVPWLWLPALLRLLIPGSIALVPYSSPLAEYRALEQTLPQAAGSATEQLSSFLPDAQAAPAGSTNPLLIVWLCGAALLALYLVVQHYGWHKRLSYATPYQGSLDAWKANQPIHRPVQVLVSPRIDSPMTCGLLRPRIYLPVQLAEETLPYVLLHEGVHIRRFHAAVRLLLCITICLHWFNPLVWLMAAMLRQDLELCCDAHVLRKAGREYAAGYARTIVCLATEKVVPSWASSFARHPVEERIMRMMKPSKLRLSGAIALGLMILLSVGMFAGAADVALPDTVTYERMTALSDIDDVREDEVFERLTGLTLDDAQLALLMAQREITLMVPDEKALPEGFALREGGTSASFRLSHGTEQILLPSGFTPPVGAPDASYEQDGYLVETWDIPAAELTETYNNLVRHYLYGDHGLVTYNVMLRTLDEALPGFTERLGVLDNGLMVVGELGGGVETIYAVPEDAYAAYSNGEPGEVTEIYIMYSRTLTTSQMMPLLESAAAL